MEAGATMIPKVQKLVALVDDGWAIESVEANTSGDVTMKFGQDGRSETFAFRWYEVPAIVHATKVVGVAE
jgi:hypothetical protein